MDNTKNELNDIILNKGGGGFSGFKKVLLAIATFAVLLIIVIVIIVGRWLHNQVSTNRCFVLLFVRDDVFSFRFRENIFSVPEPPS